MSVETGDILYGTFLLFVFFASIWLMRSVQLAILVKVMLGGGGLAALWEFYDTTAWQFDISYFLIWDLLRPERLAIAGLLIGAVHFSPA